MSSHNFRENHDSSASANGQNSSAAFGLPPEETDYESLPSNASFSSHLVAGALAGITEHSITYPLDMIKVCVLFEFVFPMENSFMNFTITSNLLQNLILFHFKFFIFHSP